MKPNCTRMDVAVSVHLEDLDDGIRVVLNDLMEIEGDDRMCCRWSLFTHRRFDRENVLNEDLTQSEYAALGQAILVRLLAHRTVQEKLGKR